MKFLLFNTVISIFLLKLHHEIQKYSEKKHYFLWNTKIFLYFSWRTVKTYVNFWNISWSVWCFIFLTDWIAIVQSLQDAIKTDSNLITQKVVWEVAITEEQRLWALALDQTHSYLLCALCCACKQYYEKEKKKLYNLGELPFPGWVDKLYYLSTEFPSGILMYIQRSVKSDNTTITTGMFCDGPFSPQHFLSMMFVLKENTFNSKSFISLHHLAMNPVYWSIWKHKWIPDSIYRHEMLCVSPA